MEEIGLFTDVGKNALKSRLQVAQIVATLAVQTREAFGQTGVPEGRTV